jgi:hypothetical protein
MSPVDLTQLGERSSASMQALELQLIHVTQDAAQFSQQSAEVQQQLQQQVNNILRLNRTDAQIIALHEQHFELHAFIKTFCSNNVASSKVEQLELLVNNNRIAINDAKQYKVITDVLAETSVSSDTFSKLETVVSTLSHCQGVTDPEVLKSVEQQRTAIADMCSKLEKLDTQSRQLQTFIGD